MPNIFTGQAFAGKHMAQVTIATGAQNLYPATIRIGFATNCSLNLIIKTGPATVRMKLVFGAIQSSITLPTDI